MDIYQDYSNYSPEIKNDPAPGFNCLIQTHIGKQTFKIFLSETRRSMPVIFGI